MRVLIGCEHSGVVRNAFSRLGHDAWSCDLLPSETAGNHIQGDVREALKEKWDLFIVHPPCTYLTNSANRWLKERPERAILLEESLDFIRYLLSVKVPRIALENPVGKISTRIRKPDQAFHPYHFGHDASKHTCLWLVNLPKLLWTKVIKPTWRCSCGTWYDYSLGPKGCPSNCGMPFNAIDRYANQTDDGFDTYNSDENRWKIRSRTYEGIANAMALQWGKLD